MLNLLIDYAKTHGLTIEPGFKPKIVRWAIVCDGTGHFLNVQELGNHDEKKNRGQIFYVCPDLSLSEMKAAGSGCRHFLVDNVEVVSLMGKNGDVRVDPNLTHSERDKTFAKHVFFISLFRQGANAIKDLETIATMLETDETLNAIQKAFSEQRFSPTDYVTFAIVERKPMFLVEDTAWHNWWRNFRQSLATKKTSKRIRTNGIRAGETSAQLTMRCFACGDLVRPARIQPKIEGLSDVGGLSMGDSLVSFKQGSFRSYFLSQAQNASVSEEMAASYRAGLNRIIKDHSQSLAGAKVVHWYAGETEVRKNEDPMGLLDNSVDFSWLEEISEEKDKERDALHRARIFVGALESGAKPRLKELDKYRYYAIVLAANSGRVVVRNWIEGRFGELAQSILSWFEDLEITNIHGNHRVNSPGIERVITCLLPSLKRGQKYKAWIKPIGDERSQLWRSATSGEVSIPYKVISKIVPLHRDFVLSGDFEETLDEQSQNRAVNLSVLYTRMGLLKAYHIRKGDKNMKQYLNEEHPSSAYHCGRLMAVIAEIQRAGLGNVSAGVIQRYYAAASVTPALVLGRLVRTSNYHFDKINYHKKREGLKDIFTGIWCRLEDRVPQVLNLEDQSLFALGFYQQIAKIASIQWEKYENQFTPFNGEGDK